MRLKVLRLQREPQADPFFLGTSRRPEIYSQTLFEMNEHHQLTHSFPLLFSEKGFAVKFWSWGSFIYYVTQRNKIFEHLLTLFCSDGAAEGEEKDPNIEFPQKQNLLCGNKIYNFIIIYGLKLQIKYSPTLDIYNQYKIK